ncbi:ankyrin repeats (3 copies) domain-containing protein [Sarocladium implicatum]|nr:ankyrin repeats (3 copies) domain-containing protein [Sarocladium implicatum]
MPGQPRKLSRFGTFFRRQDQTSQSAGVTSHVSGSAETLIPPEAHSAPIARDSTSHSSQQLRPNAPRPLTTDETRCLHTFRLTQDDRDASYEWYKDRVQDRVENTCQWFLQHENFQEWLRQRDGPLLVTADPGCGKSVLAKYLIDHGLPRNTTICYFFFKDQDQNRINQALCAVLHQLFSAKPDLLKFAQGAVDRNGDKLRNITSELCSIFEAAVNDLYARHTIFVFDALDECSSDDLKILIDLLTRIFNQASASFKVKCLMTSRPYEQVSDEFHALYDKFPRIRIPGEQESETISKEIEQVIRVRVDALVSRRRLSLRLRSHLLSRLLAISHRTYLWVYLVFDFLEKADFRRTEGGLSEVLATLPNSVTDAYEKILSRSNDACFVMRALSIIIAARKPLTLAQINVAFHIHDNYTSDLDLDLEDDDDFGLRLRTCCGLFLSINQGRVYLLHQTAREFLLSPVRPSETTAAYGRTPPGQWQGSVVIEDAELILAQSCVLRLRVVDPQSFIAETDDLSSVMWQLSRDLLGGSNLFSYSSTYWVEHVRCAQSSQGFPSLMKSIGIGDPSSETYWRLSLFVRGGRRAQYCNPIYKAPHCQLHLAAGCGHRKLVEWHLDRGIPVDSYPDESCPPALYEAVVTHHHNVVLALLARGANPDGIGPRSPVKRTAMFSATWHASDETLIALLRSGADVNHRDAAGQTPLFEAGSVSTAQILLNAGASIDAVDNSGLTPLLMAVLREDEPVLKLLIHRRANVSTRSKSNQTPLSEAARLRWWRGVEMLLLAGADVNTTMPDSSCTIWPYITKVVSPSSPPGMDPMPLSTTLLRLFQSKLGNCGPPVRTPLHIAALYNDHSCLLELLSDGAYVDAQDQAQLTPLMIVAAAKFPDTDSLELLLQAGASPNASNSQLTVLHAAVHREWDAAVQVLLAAGADPNGRDEETGSSVLHVAVSYGCMSLIKILLAGGADATLLNRNGETALQLAYDLGECQIAATIRQASAES